MSYQKGHSGYKKKGDKNLKKVDTALKKSPQAIDKYPIKKHWEKRVSKKILDQADIEFYIYNDLPLDDYYDSLNLPDDDSVWLNGNKKKRENNGNKNV